MNLETKFGVEYYRREKSGFRVFTRLTGKTGFFDFAQSAKYEVVAGCLLFAGIVSHEKHARFRIAKEKCEIGASQIAKYRTGRLG